MKVLYFAPKPPYPPNRGDQMIAYNQIKNIKKEYCDIKIILITLIDYKNKDIVNKNISKYCDKIYFFKEPTKIRKTFYLFKTLVNLKPFQVNINTVRSYQKKIKKIIDVEKPDVIHIETIRMAEYLKFVAKIPIVIDLIDALSLNMKRRMEKESIIKKIPLFIESKLLFKYEKNIIKKFDNIMIISENDKKYFQTNELIVNPMGTFINDEYLLKYKDIIKENAIVFHGSMYYFPNVQAVKILLEKIYPELKKKIPDLKIYIVGKDPGKDVMKYNDNKNIFVTGLVDDVCKYLLMCKVGVYPLETGTGMQTKILEALACGIPIVASNMAVQGIPGINGEHYISANNEKEFCDKTILLLNDMNLRTKLSINGKRFVNENFSWKKNVDILLNTWEIAKTIDN